MFQVKAQLAGNGLSFSKAATQDWDIKDCENMINRWNQVISKHELDMELKLPHRGFNRQVGEFEGASVSPDGRLVSAEDFETIRPESRYQRQSSRLRIREAGRLRK
jgi:hypothetical protein